MAVVSEMRARARHVVGPAFGICAVVYFAFHAVHGERGLRAWLRLQDEVAATQVVAADAVARRDAWQSRVDRLRPESLDPDLLDEQARRMLAYAAPNEVVILEVRP